MGTGEYYASIGCDTSGDPVLDRSHDGARWALRFGCSLIVLMDDVGLQKLRDAVREGES